MFDIAIVNYNSTDHLLHCLRSMKDSLNGLQAKIFVQDNDSDDNVDRIKVDFPEVILSRNSENIGYARAVNNLLKESAAPYIFIVNPDTLIFNGSFESLCEYMEEHPDVGIIGPKILNTDGSVQGSARAFPTPLTGLFGRSTLLTRYFPNNPITRKNVLTWNSDGRTPMEVGWVSGACMMVRREALKDVGFLDERFFMYWEDADWCKRMWSSGWKVVYLPQSSVVHHIGGSSDTRISRSVLEFHKSAYHFFNKQITGQLRPFLPLVFLALGVRLVLVLLFQGMRRGSRRLNRTTIRGGFSHSLKKIFTFFSIPKRAHKID